MKYEIAVGIPSTNNPFTDCLEQMDLLAHDCELGESISSGRAFFDTPFQDSQWEFDTEEQAEEKLKLVMKWLKDHNYTIDEGENSAYAGVAGVPTNYEEAIKCGWEMSEARDIFGGGTD
jgi:hypothetical protein